MKSNKDTPKKDTSKSKVQTIKSKSKSSKTSEDEPKTKLAKNAEPKKEEKRTLQKKSSSEKVVGSTSTAVSKNSKLIKKEAPKKKTSKSEQKITIQVPKPKANAVRRTPQTKAAETKTLAKTSVENIKKETNEKAIEYEDDFEDYESDFQECTVSEVSNMSDTESSELEPVEMQTAAKPQTGVIHKVAHKKVEEEKRFDSGHYELNEAQKRVKLDTNIPTELKEEEVVEKGDSFSAQLNNVEEKKNETKSAPLSMDEGFEEDRLSDFTKSPTNSQTSLIEVRKSKESKKVKCRAREIMNMIKLDTVQISLLECKPIPYEDFVKIFGKINARQIAVQTKEDNLNVEIQTDDVKVENKWTQYPIICRSSLTSVEDIRQFQLEQVGVGIDLEQSSPENSIVTVTYDVLKLNHFLNRAGKLILSLLERNKLGGNILQNEPHDLIFSEGFVQLSVNCLSFLNDRSVSKIQYSALSNKILMTIHSPATSKTLIEDEEKEEITKYCIGCVWNISEPSQPIKIFYSRSNITYCCFHPINCNIILGGTQDGTINIWNLTEDEMWHKKVTDKVNETDWVLRCPSYTTSGNLDVEGHNSEIVGISLLTKFERNLAFNWKTKTIPVQICSLDSDGRLIIWTILANLSKNVQDINSSVWSEISLNKSQEIALNFKGNSIKEDVIFKCKHMKADSVDLNQIYIATNSFEVLRANCLGTKVCPAVYKSNNLDVSSETTCIETCSFEKSYFMVGCNDGTIRLHSSNIEQSLLHLKAKNFSAPILTIQWSKSKPFTIYVLDDQSRIHVWDLGNSDVLPLQTLNVTKRGHIESMQLSPCNTPRDLNEQYLAIGTSNGRVEVHKLKRDFYYSQLEHTKRETEAFNQYIAIL